MHTQLATWRLQSTQVLNHCWILSLAYSMWHYVAGPLHIHLGHIVCCFCLSTKGPVYSQEMTMTICCCVFCWATVALCHFWYLWCHALIYASVYNPQCCKAAHSRQQLVSTFQPPMLQGCPFQTATCKHITVLHHRWLWSIPRCRGLCPSSASEFPSKQLWQQAGPAASRCHCPVIWPQFRSSWGKAQNEQQCCQGPIQICLFRQRDTNGRVQNTCHAGSENTGKQGMGNAERCLVGARLKMTLVAPVFVWQPMRWDEAQLFLAR